MQTIDTVIPPLVDTLRKNKGDPVAGASELLLNFVAAFEHIPIYRRQSLFQSLIDKLGPQDFLFAVLTMLMDKYNGDKTVAVFSQELVSHYDSTTQLLVSVAQMTFALKTNHFSRSRNTSTW